MTSQTRELIEIFDWAIVPLLIIVFAFELEDAVAHDEVNAAPQWWVRMHWWVLIPIAAAMGVLLYGLFRWASRAPEINAENARERFREEQDWRGLHRSGIDAAPHRQR